MTMSRMTAPVGRGDDADAAREGWERPLAGGIEESFGEEAGFELLEGELEEPAPRGSRVSPMSWSCPRDSYTEMRPRTRTARPSVGLKRSSCAWRRKRTTGSWASASFRVK